MAELTLNKCIRSRCELFRMKNGLDATLHAVVNIDAIYAQAAISHNRSLEICIQSAQAANATDTISTCLI